MFVEIKMKQEILCFYLPEDVKNFMNFTALCRMHTDARKYDKGKYVTYKFKDVEIADVKDISESAITELDYEAIEKMIKSVINDMPDIWDNSVKIGKKDGAITFQGELLCNFD